MNGVTESVMSPSSMRPATPPLPLEKVEKAVLRFSQWLDGYGENSYDFMTYYASPYGQWAKALYYRRPLLGTLAVSPMVFTEAFVPWAKRFFWKPQRFPIADAHYAMGYLFLKQVLGDDKYYDRAVHFLEVLEQTRCPGFERYCWGYPFSWATLRGTIHEGTPLITTVPYVYEAFRQAYLTDGSDRWLRIMQSTADHALLDYGEVETSPTASSCSYVAGPCMSALVVNANAYRSFVLTCASHDLSDDKYQRAAERNLNFVLEAQNPDGSWFYANDGNRGFIDHFHTCFVMKALAKIELLTGNPECTKAIERGVRYYVENLFDERGLPKPFARAPRITVYRRELYDYAECVNIATLLRGRFPRLDERLSTTLDHILTEWQRPNGAFRSRRLYLGWDNVPMHRWASSQLFRSLCFLLSSNMQAPEPKK